MLLDKSPRRNAGGEVNMGILNRLFGSRDCYDGIDARLDMIIERTAMLEERWRGHMKAIHQREERAKARKASLWRSRAKSRKNAKQGRVAIKRRLKPEIFTAGQIFRAIIGR